MKKTTGFTGHWQQGFSIAIILLSVVLLGALGLALFLSNQTTFAMSNKYHDRLIANKVMGQARALNEGIQTMTAHGIPISTITFDESTTSGLFNPALSGAQQQTPPADALAGTTPGWIWKVDSNGNAVVKIKGIGVDANPDYLIALSQIAPNVCQAINDLVHNGAGANVNVAGASCCWETPGAAIDLSTDNNVAGASEMCVTNNSGANTYYMIVQPE